jgi:hypothetical protein
MNPGRKKAELVAAFALYLLLSVWLFGRSVLFHLAGRYIGTGPDPSQYIWSLVWWPHALAHRVNPFRVPVIWAPAGFNLAWTTAIPLPSLIAYPVTRLLGPIVA